MASASIARNETLFTPSQLPVKVTGMQGMASKMWAPFLVMGFMLLVGSFIG